MFEIRDVIEENLPVTVQNADSENQRIIGTLKDTNLYNLVDIRDNYKMKGDKLI